eukprot:scaffold64_cov199-Ochromonas_danica.AAC.2
MVAMRSSDIEKGTIKLHRRLSDSPLKMIVPPRCCGDLTVLEMGGNLIKVRNEFLLTIVGGGRVVSSHRKSSSVVGNESLVKWMHMGSTSDAAVPLVLLIEVEP